MFPLNVTTTTWNNVYLKISSHIMTFKTHCPTLLSDVINNIPWRNCHRHNQVLHSSHVFLEPSKKNNEEFRDYEYCNAAVIQWGVLTWLWVIRCERSVMQNRGLKFFFLRAFCFVLFSKYNLDDSQFRYDNRLLFTNKKINIFLAIVNYFMET